jgi:hypothetical protein
MFGLFFDPEDGGAHNNICAVLYCIHILNSQFIWIMRLEKEDGEEIGKKENKKRRRKKENIEEGKGRKGRE